MVKLDFHEVAPATLVPCAVIDIETAPNEKLWSDPAFVAAVRASLTPPANYKDPAKIEAYLEDAFEKARERSALSWVHGKIRAFAIAPIEGDDEPCVVADEEEDHVLRAIVALLDAGGPALVGGFNVREFDVPFITFRLLANGYEPPTWWPNRKTWDRIVDPCDIFGRGTLSENLAAFGLPAKTGDGADAPTMPIAQLADYVANDVRVERLLIRRMACCFPMLRRNSAI